MQSGENNYVVFQIVLWIKYSTEPSVSVSTWMGDSISMSISIESLSDENLNQGPLALLLQRQYELNFGINLVQFFFPQNRPRFKVQFERLSNEAICTIAGLQKDQQVSCF